MSDFLEIIKERGSGALDKKMGIEIIEASPERLVGTMPVEGNTRFAAWWRKCGFS